MEITQKKLTQILSAWIFTFAILFSAGVFAYFNQTSALNLDISVTDSACYDLCIRTGETADFCNEECAEDEANDNSQQSEPSEGIGGECTLNNEFYSEGDDFCNEGNYYKCVLSPCNSHTDGCLGFEILTGGQAAGFCGGGGEIITDPPNDSIVPEEPPFVEPIPEPAPTNNPPLGQGYCAGTCYQLENYSHLPNGFACRGGQGTGHENQCYVCNNGQFEEQFLIPGNPNSPSNLNACSQCWGQCIGDTQARYYDSGEFCVVKPEEDNEIYKCETGKWIEQDISNKCIGQCQGDPANTVYENGHSCAAGTGDNFGIWTCEGNDNWSGPEASHCYAQCNGDEDPRLYEAAELCRFNDVCYRCEYPGQERLNGFVRVESSFCSNEPELPEPDNQQLNYCIGQCAGDPPNSKYQTGFVCAAGENTPYFGVWTCKGNLEWEGPRTEYCVNTIGFPGEEEYGIYELGESVIVGDTCFQCVEPGRNFQGGFNIVNGAAVCGLEPKAGEYIDNIPGHAEVGACLGDFNQDQKVDLLDFSIFAILTRELKFSGLPLELIGEFRYLDITHDGSSNYEWTLEDFAIFAQNYAHFIEGYGDGICGQVRETKLDINL